MWSHQPIRRCPILRWGEVADKRSCDQHLREWSLVVTSYYPGTRQPGQVNCVCCGRLMFPSCTKQELLPLGQKHYQMWRAGWCGGCVRNWLISDTPVGRRVAKAEANPTAFEGPSYARATTWFPASDRLQKLRGLITPTLRFHHSEPQWEKFTSWNIMW